MVGFRLRACSKETASSVAPPIPGRRRLPRPIGFQSVLQRAADGRQRRAGRSGLTRCRSQGEILLPAGRPASSGAADAPLRMATTANGSSQPVQPVAQAGPDGKTGTADDIHSIAPGDTATAEYLVEGRRGEHAYGRVSRSPARFSVFRAGRSRFRGARRARPGSQSVVHTDVHPSGYRAGRRAVPSTSRSRTRRPRSPTLSASRCRRSTFRARRSSASRRRRSKRWRPRTRRR